MPRTRSPRRSQAASIARSRRPASRPGHVQPPQRRPVAARPRPGPAYVPRVEGSERIPRGRRRHDRSGWRRRPRRQPEHHHGRGDHAGHDEQGEQGVGQQEAGHVVIPSPFGASGRALSTGGLQTDRRDRPTTGTPHPDRGRRRPRRDRRRRRRGRAGSAARPAVGPGTPGAERRGRGGPGRRARAGRERLVRLPPPAGRRDRLVAGPTARSGRGGALPLVVALHGLGEDHSTLVGPRFGLDRYLAAAVRDDVPPFAIATVDGGTSYWHRRPDGEDAARDGRRRAAAGPGGRACERRPSG